MHISDALDLIVTELTRVVVFVEAPSSPASPDTAKKFSFSKSFKKWTGLSPSAFKTQTAGAKALKRESSRRITWARLRW